MKVSLPCAPGADGKFMKMMRGNICVQERHKRGNPAVKLNNTGKTLVGIIDFYALFAEEYTNELQIIGRTG
mgnify:FL=1